MGNQRVDGLTKGLPPGFSGQRPLTVTSFQVRMALGSTVENGDFRLSFMVHYVACVCTSERVKDTPDRGRLLVLKLRLLLGFPCSLFALTSQLIRVLRPSWFKAATVPPLTACGAL